MEYSKAPQTALKMVKDIADKYHKHLGGIKIAVVMRAKASNHHGMITLATASGISPKLKPFLNDDYTFLITIGGDEWLSASTEKRKALIDHELCHCAVDAKGKRYIRPHDYEEFAVIVKRHGFWRNDTSEKAIQEVLWKQGVEVGTLDPKKGKQKKAAARSGN